jgi:uncharacterized protein (TIGR00251 family)
MVEKEQARIIVRVRPNASQNEVLHFKDRGWHLRIAAPPIKGKANQELIKFLSDILRISKRRLIIEKGMTGKSKVIRIDESTQDQVIAQLARLGK